MQNVGVHDRWVKAVRELGGRCWFSRGNWGELGCDNSILWGNERKGVAALLIKIPSIDSKNLGSFECRSNIDSVGAS